MFKRIREMNVARINEEVGKIPAQELDKEYERLTGMECDIAARKQSDKDFAETIIIALSNIKKRRGKIPEEMAAAYA